MDAQTNHQAGFAARWGHLTNPHVRTLAWLLDAPDLLDVADPHWAGKIATLGAPPPAVADWLARLDADPAPLLDALSTRNYTRLGLYAEKLMAFYYGEQGMLVAHGLQVRASRNDTVGEFDFLLDAGPDGVDHIEFATKLYLLQGAAARHPESGFDTFVGPNLADTLGKKMRKVIERQLTLGEHPAAQAILPRPVVRARALVKGWLFYPHGANPPAGGISPLHCRGFWCAPHDMAGFDGARFVVLPRLQWLAPYQAPLHDAVLDRHGLQARLSAQFAELPSPVLTAVVEQRAGMLVETARGFIVPDDWGERAARQSVDSK